MSLSSEAPVVGILALVLQSPYRSVAGDWKWRRRHFPWPLQFAVGLPPVGVGGVPSQPFPFATIPAQSVLSP